MGTSDSDKKTTGLSLDDFMPYRLSVLSNAVSRSIAGIYEKEFDITIGQWRVIAVLGEATALTSTEVATRTVMEKPAVSRATASLLERGLIDRTPDNADRRRAPLKLTRAGRAIYDAVIPLALECERELLSSLSGEEVTQLRTLLDKLAEAASPQRRLWQVSET